MVNVSKSSLSQKKLDDLFDQLNSTIGRLDDKQSDAFLSSLLGHEEKIMLAKRLAAIIMLINGQSLYRVSDVLKISPTTAKAYRDALAKGSYSPLIKAIKKKKANYVQLIETVDSILHLGGVLPHYGQTHASEAYKRRQGKL